MGKSRMPPKPQQADDFWLLSNKDIKMTANTVFLLPHTEVTHINIEQKSKEGKPKQSGLKEVTCLQSKKQSWSFSVKVEDLAPVLTLTVDFFLLEIARAV